MGEKWVVDTGIRTKFTDYTFYMVLTFEPLFTCLIFNKKKTQRINEPEYQADNKEHSKNKYFN